MKKKLLTLLAMAALVFGARYQAGAATVYTTEAGFLTATSGYTLYLNDFDDVPVSPSSGLYGPSYAGSGLGFGYTITALGSSLYYVHPGGNAAISTAEADDTLTVTMTGAPVTAVGGLFLNTDEPGAENGGTVTITLSDATFVTVASASFRGFTSGGPAITSVAITSSTEGVHFPTLDHFYVGAEAPPVGVPDGGLTAMLLGISTLASGWLRRRVR